MQKNLWEIMDGQMRFIKSETVMIQHGELIIHRCIVPDYAAGKHFRYTVYNMPQSATGRVKIIGRELTLSVARKIASKI